MRISGITIPEDKQLSFALTSVYGIGRSRAREVLENEGIDPTKSARDITSTEEQKIRKHIEDQFTIEGDLKREVSGNIKRLKDINAYRGNRHARNLPARGQRTRVNSRTVRGNMRKTMGSGRRKLEKK